MEQSSDRAESRHISTETLVWEGVTLSIAYEPSWLAMSEDYGPAHLEMHVVAPEGAPLPITETGYRSHFLARGIVEEHGGPVAYVRVWLDEAARAPGWKHAQVRRAQLSLF
ncbi:MAG TPA: hypothetical protein VGO55_05640 [Allosphingosinicella sp.]|jgi:hypothetical protein|nr:hypothetical protein [Allosphingosinicella sp.]